MGTVDGVAHRGMRVDAKQMVGSGLHIFGRDGYIRDIAADRIGAADDSTPRDAAACEDGRIRSRPMMTSRAFGLRVDLWSSSMLAGAENQSFVEQAALFEILDQRGKALIKDR
jgi:hypothetical protein